MSATSATEQATLGTTVRPVRPRRDDFLERTEKKSRLTECPLCALDPGRERHLFGPGDIRWRHFFDEHGPDDVGRPMAELLPGLDGGADVE